MQAKYRGLAVAVMRRPMTGDHQILTTKEVSEMLGVHMSTVYKLIKEGKIPSFRVGSDWRFRREQIVRWLAEQ
jgi:excisionase family DNA binding protein